MRVWERFCHSLRRYPRRKPENAQVGPVRFHYSIIRGRTGRSVGRLIALGEVHAVHEADSRQREGVFNRRFPDAFKPA